ncbi:hypothetical protein Cgig2_015613 [Carnegiea gigantea]|uniref:Uncharacterized protein n=1 Tax=Carnegiea gigantea TaxID=171969 RepID=A0A9Q1GRL9_9CARY|nr:hypothetical protein Cgig2_015613 [Carnegiea gigantea]
MGKYNEFFTADFNVVGLKISTYKDLFSRKSVAHLMIAFKHFSECSSLKPNPKKSQIVTAGVTEETKDKLAYLAVIGKPQRMSKSDFQTLIDRIIAREEAYFGGLGYVMPIKEGREHRSKRCYQIEHSFNSEACMECSFKSRWFMDKVGGSLLFKSTNHLRLQTIRKRQLVLNEDT